LRARTLPKTIAITAAILIALIALAVVPASFDLEARGVLQPVIKQDVFADIDGVITAVYVKHGDIVHKGQELLKLKNTDLEVQLTELRGQLASVQRQLNYVRQSSDRRTLPGSSENPTSSSDYLILEARRDGLQDQIDLLREKEKRLVVLSPIAGKVVTWNVEQHLMHRPVRVGEVLMGVVDPKDNWELEIYMPETRMGHLKHKMSQLADGEQLVVTYILATEPSRRLSGKVGPDDVAGASELHDEEGNSTALRIHINKQDVHDPRPGATVIADVHCGWAPVGYVWFHEAIEWVQKTWFYYL
jgi:hypothetical protein